MDNFKILPIEIVVDILTRLLTASVLDCKLVSKTWRNLIRYPSFSKLHLDRLNHSADLGKLSFLALADNGKLYYFEYNENHETPIRITRIKFTSPLKFNNDFLGSINGLICLRDSTSNFCICNPMTKEYVILPQPKRKLCPDPLCGFGYLPSTNEYKVFAIYKEAFSFEVVIYTLGSGRGWRNVGKFVFDLYNNKIGVFLNGALYFMSTNSGIIVVYDLADENIREYIRIPASCHWKSRLGVLGGLLRYTTKSPLSSYRTSYDIWLYKKQNDNHDTKEQEQQYQSMGWNKEFNISDTDVLGFTKSGRVLSYDSTNYLNICDPKTSTTEMLMDLGAEQYSQIFPHKNTLVLLKELGEKDAKIMELEKVVDTEAAISR